MQNGGPDPVTQPPGLSVPSVDRAQAPGREHARSTRAGSFTHSAQTLRRARCGNVATRSQARGRRARGGGKPRRRRPSWEDRPPAPSLPGGSPSPCASRVGQLCEQTPHHHGTQGVRWAEVGQAGPSSPGCGWREREPPEWATWLGPSDGGAHPLPGSPFIMGCNQPAHLGDPGSPGLAPIPGDSPAEIGVNMPSPPSPPCALGPEPCN